MRTEGSSGKVTETSVTLRVTIAATVMVAIAGVMSQQGVDPITGIVALAVTPLASYVAHIKRDSRQIPLKLALAAGLLVAFANFLRDVSGATSVDDTRGPLAEIFLWVLVMHAFDQPRRRDLQFSIAASAALIALGGALSLSSSFLFFFIPWGALSLAALYLTYRSEAQERNAGAVIAGGSKHERLGPRALVSAAGGWRRALISILILVLISTAVFAIAPRGRGGSLRSLPFELPRIVPLPEGSGIVNPGLPQSGAPPDPDSPPAEPDPDAYFGFAEYVDLRVRGTLSHEIVMRVRAPEPAFWRGAVFDTYRSSVWSLSNDDSEPAGGSPIFIGDEPRSGQGPSVETTQTFYLEKQMTNIVFAAYHPREVWFPGGSLRVNGLSAMRAGFVLESGLVYSVVSDRPAPRIADLDIPLPSSEPPDDLKRYLQIPSELPSRVHDLADQIMGDIPTVWGKVTATERWLKENTQYVLNPPRQPRGSDAVDNFLFNHRVGNCEQITSAMVMMLRSQGIPARYAVGYLPGERNLFSGYFDVRASDAHSWVEVYFPGTGWLEFDPTSEVPFASLEERPRIPAMGWISSIARAIGDLIPSQLGRSIAAFARSTFAGLLSVAPFAAGLLILGALFSMVVIWMRRRSGPRRALERLVQHAEGVERSFAMLEVAGALMGSPRAPHQTPAEFGEELASGHPMVSREDLQKVLDAIHEHVYRGGRLGADAALEAERAAERIMQRAHEAASR